MTELTEIDIQILRFVSKSEPASLEAIKLKFPTASSIEYRVKLLSTPEYRRVGNLPITNPVPNSSYLSQDRIETVVNGRVKIEMLGTYRLTENGQKFLQDYGQKARSDRKELWLKNAWIPILVTLATNLVISGVKWLFPLIVQWLASSLR